jgi:PilZ domain
MQPEALQFHRALTGATTDAACPSSIEAGVISLIGWSFEKRLMSTEQIRQERRSCQRFELHLPVRVRAAEECGSAFTQNLSIRGALLYTDLRLDEGKEVELILVMPSEITLSESMCVRCRGRVLRATLNGQKSVLAVQVEKYEFLPQTEETSSQFRRISALHDQAHVQGIRSSFMEVTPIASGFPGHAASSGLLLYELRIVLR